MNLNLTRPLVFFDLEATGTDPKEARIIQIAAIRISPDGEQRSFSMLINPTVAIPQVVCELTGLSDEMVAGKPTFRDVAPQLYLAFEGCDVGGYHAAGYDVPLLTNEFKRAGRSMPPPEDRVVVDPCAIALKHEKRDLTWAARFYCDIDLDEHAHQAEADASAALGVFFAQLNRYPINEGDGTLAEIMRDAMWPYVDVGRRLKYDEEGEVILAFSKHQGRRLRDVWFSDAGFIDWMLDPTKTDFPDDTRAAIRHHLRDVRPTAGVAVNA